MVNIIAGKEITFSTYRFDAKDLRNMRNSFMFTGNRPITRAMLMWWAFHNEHQELFPLGTRLEIEHIYAKNRFPVPDNIEALGNKSILEKDINIRASDYRFKDKANYYLARVPGKTGTKVHELVEMAKTRQDFTGDDIRQRTQEMIDTFMDFITGNNLFR